jgi:amino acid transporter
VEGFQPFPIRFKTVLGLVGLTSTAMAFIAPGAFLWLTFAQQSAYGAPSAGCAMWFGTAVALVLCLATGVSYAELSKLYPGAGSSYFFAEQAFLSKGVPFLLVRIIKFTVGWVSYLYYWVYAGVMVAVLAIVAGFMLGQILPDTFNASEPSALLMGLFCVALAFIIPILAIQKIRVSTSLNLGINFIQIAALVVFSVLAIGHRLKVHQGDPAWTLDSAGNPTQFVQDTIPDPTRAIPDLQNPARMIQDPTALMPKVSPSGAPVWVYVACNARGSVVNGPDGNPLVVPTDANGNVLPLPAAAVQAGAATAKPQVNTIDYSKQNAFGTDSATGQKSFNWHPTAGSVVAPHALSYVIIQACIGVLILVGFESATTLGEEARNPRRDVPRAVIGSLLIQGGFCYLLEYFAANYFQSSCYTNPTASGSAAPIGDMAQLIGAYWFGSPRAGWWCMMIMASTVALALLGTTLSGVTAGSRMTYAMGRDKEIPGSFGVLHGRYLTPHRAIWAMGLVAAVIGVYSAWFFLCGPAASSALDTNLTPAMNAGPWYRFGAFSNAKAATIPNSLLITTLVSNFGTFLLYTMTCATTMVAFLGHRSFNIFKHLMAPAVGIVFNLACMAFYVAGPFLVPGMSKHEPFIALAVVVVWGLLGLLYFLLSGDKKMLQATTEGAALVIPWATVVGSPAKPPPLPGWYGSAKPPEPE